MQMQAFRVDIDLDSERTSGEILSALAAYSSLQQGFLASRTRRVAGSLTMILEFTSYEDAVAFTMNLFGVSVEDAKKYVETITV